MSVRRGPAGDDPRRARDPIDRPVSIVTGGAGGIGAAIGQALMARGYVVVVADLKEAIDRVDGGSWWSLAVPTDVSDEQQVEHLVAATIARYGRLDALFANAAVAGSPGPLADSDSRDWDRVVAVGLRGTYLSMRAAVPFLLESGGGSIVCTGSVAALRGGLGPHAYTAVKHGVWGLVQSAAAELGPRGVRVNMVAPGGVPTRLTARLFGESPEDLEAAVEALSERAWGGRPTSPQDVAEAAVFLASPEARRINGTHLVVDHGESMLGTTPSEFGIRSH